MAEQDYLELKIDVVKQLGLYRSVTFKDKLSFLDEAVQNAQRAKSKEIKVDVYMASNTIVITNDGIPLSDPQDLFTIAHSGWDEETIMRENPFGLGFLSNVSVSPYMEIKSGKYEIIFDVDKIIETGDTTAIELITVGPESYVEGFIITLKKFDFELISENLICKRMETLGKYTTDIDVIYNGDLIPRVDIFGDIDDPEIIKIDSNGARGIVKLKNTYLPKITIFYRGRLVKELTELPGVEGTVYIEDSTLTLSAPDRKDIIRDHKYDEFIDLIQSKVRDYSLTILGDRDQTDRLSGVIEHYLEVSDLHGNIDFLLLDGHDDYEYIKDIIRMRKEHYVSDMNELNYYLRQERKPVNKQTTPIELELTPKSTDDITERIGPLVVYPQYLSTDYIEDVAIPVDYNYLSNMKTIRFWVKMNEIEYYEKSIELARQYKLPIILSRTALEAKVLNNMESSNLITHIRNIEDSMKVTATISSINPINQKEERMDMLLDLVSRMAGFEDNVFILGDLEVITQLSLPGGIIRECREEKDISVIHQDGVIYIDRRYIRAKYSRQDLSGTLSVQDYKFILANLDEFSKQMSLISGEFPLSIYRRVVEELAK